MPIIADIAAGPIFLIAGLLLGLLAFLPIVLIEALVLWRLEWGSWWRSVRDALIVNIATTIVGFLLGPFWENLWRPCTYPDGGPDCHIDGKVVALVLAWALSVAIEGGLLLWLGKHEARRTFQVALAINAASYLALTIYLVVWGSFTG